MSPPPSEAPVLAPALRLDAAALRQRLADPDSVPRDRPSPQEDLDRAARAGGRIVQAAVLVPLVVHPEPTVLLTLRSARLSSHAGQVSFPGGRMEAGETPEEAALREAEEEVGLDPGLPELVGRLPSVLTGTGYLVTPVVALLRPPFGLRHDPAEVEEPFEYPLARLLDPAAPERRRQEFRGRIREFWVWPHERHYIWGATASMLVTLAAVLRGRG
ncbi:CoA pyrophosphatase [Roseomonas alkaliterrae]|uniref:8-oxo-dGTP pyrophosphatase MutT (NUDIX family) n=1 Tax=Neoroseomonas alkaliterrae TaxID=1452450 RepID=A0A840XSB4_9PROT|nr:CoA pyrophosphatase [Neoroseomonas alkaliterrae]MBB5691435.1 8-oxo-dGTP pyrophosphatase MutT (NUDIX family) [Neoroseomonas alkaliterrae]MBR0675571.1 CoA pyrophosphatase [Neoroseomonas alkaliterrae]